jgi:hypothetical protein
MTPFSNEENAHILRGIYMADGWSPVDPLQLWVLSERLVTNMQAPTAGLNHITVRKWEENMNKNILCKFHHSECN